MTKETRDPPIDERRYLIGLSVVDIGDYRVSRGQTRRPFAGCVHRRVTYDSQERRIWCRDCERDVDPFDAFVGLARSFHRAVSDLNRRRDELDQAERYHVRSLAAKAIDKAWRARRTVPACPHCRHGLFPEDFKQGVTRLSREYATARRARQHHVLGNNLELDVEG